MTYIAITIVIVWAVLVARWIYNGAVEMGGKLSPHRPTVWGVVSSWVFLTAWGVPTAIFLAIFGGVFWW